MADLAARCVVGRPGPSFWIDLLGLLLEQQFESHADCRQCAYKDAALPCWIGLVHRVASNVDRRFGIVRPACPNRLPQRPQQPDVDCLDRLGQFGRPLETSFATCRRPCEQRG